MNDRDRILGERFEAVANQRDDSDWLDVRRRARRRRLRRMLLPVLAATVAVAVVAPALGLRLPPIDFWRADEAPPKVIKDFETLDVGAPPGMAVDIVPGETRKVLVPDPNGKNYVLYVAPTRYGGFCTLMRGGGGCDRLGTVPLSVSWSASRPVRLTGRPPRVLPVDYDWISGYVNSDYADSVEVRFADGSTVELLLVWISQPIGAGFFVYEIPPTQRAEGHEIEAVIARNAEGELVTEDRPNARMMSVPPSDALIDEKRARARTPTSAGEAVLWVAPTRYEGQCAWYEVGDRAGVLSRCLPKGYGDDPRAEFRFVPLADDVLLVGRFDPRFASVEVHFSDGTVEGARPANGLLLYRIASEHFIAGREVIAVVGRRADGEEIVRFPWKVRGEADPCQLPQPLGARANSCP